ncbi:MAG: 50S ribosomal protein L6 [Candidatus Makana argininalis]
MSRISKIHINIPLGVNIILNTKKIIVMHLKNKLTFNLNKNIKIKHFENKINVYPRLKNKKNWSIAGTTRSILNNMIKGIKFGFIKKLKLVGVGYRALVDNNTLILSLGFSHNIIYNIPKDVIITCPIQNEIVIKGCNKQVIGQVASDIRSYKKPEPYKGKGIRYNNEIIHLKDKKKK